MKMRIWFLFMLFPSLSNAAPARQFTYVSPQLIFAISMDNERMALRDYQSNLFIILKPCNLKMVDHFWKRIESIASHLPETETTKTKPYLELDGKRRWAMLPKYDSELRTLGEDFILLMSKDKRECGL